MEHSAPKGWPRLVSRALLDGVVAAIILLDEAIRPLFRPLIAWFARLRLVARAEAWIAMRPPYVVLVLLAVPLAVAEPLKLVALLVMARGGLLPGLVLMGFAHLASFLLVERVYHAGRAKLFSIGWFARAMTVVIALRERVLAFARGTAAWRRARTVIAEARVRLASLRRRIRPG